MAAAKARHEGMFKHYLESNHARKMLEKVNRLRVDDFVLIGAGPSDYREA